MKQHAFFTTALAFVVAGVLIFNWGLYNSVPQSSLCTPMALLLTGDPVCGWSDFAYFGSRIALALGLVLALGGLLVHRRIREKVGTYREAHGVQAGLGIAGQ